MSAQYQYCPLFCEENIWQLCQHRQFDQVDKKVLVISNSGQTCAIWQQKSAAAPHLPVIWDYHVVMLANIDGWRVWDLDSCLDLGIDLEDYLAASFVLSQPHRQRLKADIAASFSAQFRLFNATDYVNQFYSDRSHMLDSQGVYLSQPPSWPMILGANKLTLARLLNMDNDDVHSVFSLMQALKPN